MANRKTTEEKRAILQEMARMIVEGASWSAVAKKLGYASPKAAAEVKYRSGWREMWLEEFEKARNDMLHTVEAEAMRTARELMQPVRYVYDRRGKRVVDETGSPVLAEQDPHIRQSAAHSLLNHARRLYAQKVELTGKDGGPVEVAVQGARDKLEHIIARYETAEGSDDRMACESDR